MRIDRIVIYLFLAVIATIVVVTMFVRLKSEEVEFNVRSGDMHVNSFIAGFQYNSIEIDSNLRWISNIKSDESDFEWIMVSRYQSGLILKRRKFTRHIGMVYMDAITLLGLSYTGDELAHGMHMIRTSNSERIWKYREQLRGHLTMKSNASIKAVQPSP